MTMQLSSVERFARNLNKYDFETNSHTACYKITEDCSVIAYKHGRPMLKATLAPC